MEAVRSSMGDTVKVLVTAVTNDRELTRRLCVAVNVWSRKKVKTEGGDKTRQ